MQQLLTQDQGRSPRPFTLLTFLQHARKAAIWILCAMVALPAAAQVGTWDLVFSGRNERGVAVLTFTTDRDENNNFTFSGYEISVSKSAFNSNGGRGTGDLRNPEDPGSEIEDVLLGFGRVHGPWTFDSKGRIVGNLIREDFTDTQSFSFVGKFRGGSKPRLTLVYTSPDGKVTYRGKPELVLQDISGIWQGTKVEKKVPAFEFFTLTPAALDNPFPTNFPDVGDYPNIYFSMNGTGPGYTFFGATMVSRHKQIGFVFKELRAAEDTGSETNEVSEGAETLRSSVGQFINNKRMIGGKTKGTLEGERPFTFKSQLTEQIP